MGDHLCLAECPAVEHRETQRSKQKYVPRASWVSSKAKNILTKYQQIVHMNCSSWSQGHRDANLRRKVSAECVLGSYLLNPRQLKSHEGKIWKLVARGTVAPKNHSPATFLRTELYSVGSVFANPQCAAKPSKGPVDKKEPRPLECLSFPFSCSNIMKANPDVFS